MILLAAIIVSVILFFIPIYRQLWYAFRIPKVRKKIEPDIPRRIYILIRNVLFQGKLFKDLGGGIMHALFFWTFLAFGLYSLDFLLAGINPAFQLMTPGLFSDIVFFSVDIFALISLVDVFHSVIRRWIIKVKRYQGYNGFEAAIILIFVEGLMITYFILGVLRLDGVSKNIPGSIMEFLSPSVTPVTYAFATLLPKATGAFGVYAYWITWSIHASIFLAFLIYIPRAKHLHLVFAPFNVFFSDRKGAQLNRIDFEHETRFGATDIRDFSWKDYFDFYSCTECGRCTANCPANISGKHLSPRDIIWDLRVAVLSQGKQLMQGKNEDEIIKPVIGDPIPENDLWSCTTCMACVEQCPVMIDHVPKIVNMRRSLVLNEGKAPREVIDLYRNLEQYKSPYTIDPSTRGDWAKDLGVLDLSEKDGDYDVLFWVGCVQSFDKRNQEIAKSMVKIFNKAGIKFAILGKDETCTGDPARRTGNEYLFDILAQENVQKFEQKGIKNKKIVTACAHCYNSFKNDYKQYGLNLEVYHHTEFIDELIREGRIKLKSPESSENNSYTYHDPCYLGRYNKVYDAPREVIGNFALNYKEMEMNKSKGLCCGGGGGRLWMDEKEGKQMSHVRIDMAAETGASRVVTACPYCLTMLDDARKTTNREDKMEVIDIAEEVAARLL